MKNKVTTYPRWYEGKVKKSERPVKELIYRRRWQMLIHSCIYYELDSNLISDFQWQEWAEELRELQNNNPKCCNLGFYDKDFEGWNGDTGAMLPLRDPRVIGKARWLLDANEFDFCDKQ